MVDGHVLVFALRERRERTAEFRQAGFGRVRHSREGGLVQGAALSRLDTKEGKLATHVRRHAGSALRVAAGTQGGHYALHCLGRVTGQCPASGPTAAPPPPA